MSETETWQLFRMQGEMVTVVSEAPHPPGSRVQGVVQDGTTVTLKTHSCKKRDDGKFDLHGRLLNLPRDVRERLERLV